MSAAVARRLAAQGITNPLPIQEAAIPEALAGHDICGRAPTGSGKTLAFGIPLVTRATGSAPGRPRALVLVPTRELAEQLRTVVASLLDDPRRVTALYGGTGYTPQRSALRRGVDIVVACPGRLEDLMRSGDVTLGDVQTVVLDEADRMVDMGFVKPVCRLVEQTAAGRQLLLFSATIGAEVDGISRRFQSRPFRYEVEGDPAEGQEVAHLFWRAPRDERIGITARLVEHHGQAFVFCRTKRGVDRVTRQLRAAGVEAAPIHGDRSQPQRDRALAGFVSRRTRALVATDVVARGIHVDDVACVVHFDPAVDTDTYVHRSGRTGRAGNAGTVVSLVPDELRDDIRALQRALGLPRYVGVPFEQLAAAPVSAPGIVPGVRAADGRMTGTVKFFDRRRGFGFLSSSSGAEVFVHNSAIRPADGGDPFLIAGQDVTFEIAVGRRGDEARHVVPVSGTEIAAVPAPDRPAPRRRRRARQVVRA